MLRVTMGKGQYNFRVVVKLKEGY